MKKLYATLALEPRISRRAYGHAVVEALKNGRATDRAFRLMMADREAGETAHTAYAIMTLAYPKELNLEGGYEQYRRARVVMLRAYLLNVMAKFRHLKRVIGIALEPDNGRFGQGSSEDLVYFEPTEWSLELQKEAETLREKYDIFSAGRMTKKTVRTDEYPGASASSSRKHNNASAARKTGRNEPCPCGSGRKYKKCCLNG